MSRGLGSTSQYTKLRQLALFLSFAMNIVHIVYFNVNIAVNKGVYLTHHHNPNGGHDIVRKDVEESNTTTPTAQVTNSTIITNGGHDIVRKDVEKSSTTTPTAQVTNSTIITDEDFPYPLTCKKSELHSFLERNHLSDPKQFNAAMALHVGMVNNWKDIIKDQMNTLKECGLMDTIDRLMISYSNGSLDDLFQVLDPFLERYSGENRFNVTTVKATHSPWEGPAMNMIHQHCNEQSQPRNAVVFYIHNKGASKWHKNWKEAMLDTNQTYRYGHSLYWRKYLEYFLIERPALCLDKILLQNATTCGANWHPEMENHYSGNFWSASCKHIQRLEPIPLNQSNYVASEMWLAKYPERESNKESHASLHATNWNLYRHMIKPEEYRYTKI